MRMSKIHRVVVAGVAMTIATATVVTFTRGEPAESAQVASLPGASTAGSPTVSGSTSGPDDVASETERQAQDTTSRSKTADNSSTADETPTTGPSGTGGDIAPASPATTPAPSHAPPEQPTAEPEPAPAPTPTKPSKNFLESLLGG